MPTHAIKSRVGKLKTRVGKLKIFFGASHRIFSPKISARPGLKPCRRPWFREAENSVRNIHPAAPGWKNDRLLFRHLGDIGPPLMNALNLLFEEYFEKLF